MTAEELTDALRLNHELIEAWRDNVAKLRIELHGSVPEAVFEDHVRLTMRERYSEDWDRLSASGVELDCMRAELEVRMVEAHEWFKSLRVEN